MGVQQPKNRQHCLLWGVEQMLDYPRPSHILKLYSDPTQVEIYNYKGTCNQGSKRQPTLRKAEGYFGSCASVHLICL